MHTNRRHIHVHAAIRLTSPTGEKLHPGIQDFNRWRATLAEQARERNVPMEAVRRFDQAHAPAYKLKDVKMVERGIAPESVRRRIERVKNHEVHRPTRPEGRKRATEAASQWRSVAARGGVPLPPLAAGAMRLYRAEAATEGTHRGTLFVNDRALAETYLAQSDGARTPLHRRSHRSLVGTEALAQQPRTDVRRSGVVAFARQSRGPIERGCHTALPTPR